MYHITTARFTAGRSTTTPHLWQYDYGQILKIEGLDLPFAYEVHFSNEEILGTSKTSIGDAEGVTIPDEYLLSGQNIYAWIFLHDDTTDGETEYKIKIPVKKRSQPTDIEPTPVQQDTITQAIAALDAAVAQTGQDVETTAGYVQEAAQIVEDVTASVENAAKSAQDALEYAQRAEQASQDVSDYAERAETAAQSAEASAEASATSAASSAQSMQNAGAAANAAGQLVGQAANYAYNASQSASQASSDANYIRNQMSDITAKWQEAVSSASSASESATSASESATAAAGSAQTAQQARTDAMWSASEASTHKNQASRSATAAEQSATSASASATAAEQSATSAAQSAQTAQEAVASIPDVEADIEELRETKADKDGIYPDLIAGNLASSQQITDKVPYLLRPSGGNSREYDTIIGGSVYWNQLVPKTAASKTVAGGVSVVNNGDGSFTFSGTSTSSERFQFSSGNDVNVPANHVLFIGGISGGSISTFYLVGSYQGSLRVNAYNDIVAKSSYAINQFSLRVINGNTFDTPITVKPQLFDLTAMFGSVIADYIYSLETATAGSGVDWLKTHFPAQFNAGYQAYNAGEIVSISGLESHVMRDADDQIIGNYPLDDSLTLRGIYKLDENNLLYCDGDVYEAGGTVTRRYTEYTITGVTASHITSYNTDTGFFRLPTGRLPGVKYKANIFSKDWQCITSGSSSAMPDKSIYVDNTEANPYIFIKDSAFINSTAENIASVLNTVTLIYELATPATEQAEPYASPQKVDVNGTEEYVTTSNLPVGHETKYYVDLKRKLEELPDSFIEDVQVNGTSVLNGGVANIPIAGTNAPGVVKIAGNGITIIDQIIRTQASTETEVRAGTNMNKPIVPLNQHQSAFYGLAKAAGDTSQSASSNAVGTYTDDAKIAIQKMLGIYEAPWELIREDTFTNETAANHIISVDNNGQPFELTDIRLIIHTPTQETQASITDYGRIHFYYTDTLTDIMYINAYTQAAGATGTTSAVSIEQNGGMIQRISRKKTSNNGETSMSQLLNIYTSQTALWEMASKTYKKIQINAVTGKCQYKLFGKRKW